MNERHYTAHVVHSEHLDFTTGELTVKVRKTCSCGAEAGRAHDAEILRTKASA